MDREWWRGTGEDDRIQLRRDIEEAARSDPNSDRFDRLMVGSGAYALMRSATTRPETVVAVFSQIVADIELRIRNETKAMLQCADAGSPEAREHHFKARVAGAMIGLLNELIRIGDEAKDQLNNTNEASHG